MATTMRPLRGLELSEKTLSITAGNISRQFLMVIYCNLLIFSGFPAHLPVLAEKKHGYAQRCGSLGKRQRHPYSIYTQESRQQEETRHEKNHTAKQGEDRGRPDALHTLIIADRRQIQNEEDKRRRHWSSSRRKILFFNKISRPADLLYLQIEFTAPP